MLIALGEYALVALPNETKNDDLPGEHDLAHRSVLMHGADRAAVRGGGREVAFDPPFVRAERAMGQHGLASGIILLLALLNLASPRLVERSEGV